MLYFFNSSKHEKMRENSKRFSNVFRGTEMEHCPKMNMLKVNNTGTRTMEFDIELVFIVDFEQI